VSNESHGSGQMRPKPGLRMPHDLGPMSIREVTTERRWDGRRVDRRLAR